MTNTIQTKGCEWCGDENTDHFTISHGEEIYTCEKPQEIDMEEHYVMMGWIQ